MDEIESPPSKNDLAQRRTELAEERTLLAKQRTYAAWVRTGLAALAVGFVGSELLSELRPQWLIRTAGFALIAAAGIIFILGLTGYAETFRKLRRSGIATMPLWIMIVISVVFVLVTLAGLALMIMN